MVFFSKNHYHSIVVKILPSFRSKSFGTTIICEIHCPEKYSVKFAKIVRKYLFGTINSKIWTKSIWNNKLQIIRNNSSHGEQKNCPEPEFEENIAKGTTDPRVEFISQVQIQILIKFHLKNLDQASTSKSQPNISLSINLKLQNLDQTWL